MARIPDEEIERLKTEVSLERLAEARGIKFERRGADLFGLCPFHEDHTHVSIRQLKQIHTATHPARL